MRNFGRFCRHNVRRIGAFDSFNTEHSSIECSGSDV